MTSSVVTYRTAAIHSDDILVRLDGIRVTSPTRTAMDLARTVNFDDLVSIVEQVQNERRYSDDEMRRVALDFERRRPWVRDYLDALDERLAGAPAESDPEVVVGRRLRSAGVTGLVRQFGITLPVYGAVRFDLAVPNIRWAIEVDMYPTHGETIGARRDARRDQAALRAGWNVSRISRTRYEVALDAEIDALAALFRQPRRAAG